ncbi:MULTISPECIES: hypothetical protein [unclassified Nostoc]|uniref:hypothetical protein n=1 Tax=unclassified Nostoc TaxID=2593658 RepID=UPI002AD28805|nr:hypothetical protein [Nostoc sp. EspVER01]MDZ7943929.1 hypothetical protein [Nostoc sp. EfeVER01]MDZ7992281.1 hypothetical protein [Nostoc sp. EspVER01]
MGKLKRRSHFGETSGAIGILRTTFRKGDRILGILQERSPFDSLYNYIYSYSENR